MTNLSELTLVPRVTANTDVVAQIERMIGSQDYNPYEIQFTDAGLVYLSGLTNLSKLDLTGTRVTDAGLVHLKRLTKLVTLDIHWNTSHRRWIGTSEGPDASF